MTPAQGAAGLDTPPPPITDLLARLRSNDAATLQRLARLVDGLLETAGRLNLTGDRTAELFWPRHVEDGLRALERVEQRLGRLGDIPTAGPVLDVGSGAGLPGLVWAAVRPRAAIDLLDARARRCRFLQQMAERLELANVRVHKGRAEDLAHRPELRERYGLVVARALAPMAVLAELTLPFARSNGAVAAIKSADIDQELAAATGAVRRTGGETIERLPYTRSDGKACCLLWLRRHGAVPDGLPRRSGTPARRPLR